MVKSTFMMISPNCAREQDGTRYANNGKRKVKLVLDGHVQ